MSSAKKGIRVAVNGYGVIGKRVADAVAKQEDMELVGVVDVIADWRARVAVSRSLPLFGAGPEHAETMRKAGLPVAGTLVDLLGQAEVLVDCTPKKVAALNVEKYHERGVKFILQGGEKHTTTGHSFPEGTRHPSHVPIASVGVPVVEPHWCGSRACGVQPDRHHVVELAAPADAVFRAPGMR